MTADLGEAVDKEASPNGATRFAALARAYIRFAVERASLFELMFRHDILEGSGEGLRKHSTAAFALARDLLAARTDDPEASAVDLWLGVHGLAVLASRRGLEVITDEDTDALLHRQIHAHLG